jgi:mRNA interferase MazF
VIGAIVRGGLYFADFLRAGDKRVLVVSWNRINDVMRSPIVCLVTSRAHHRALPTHVPIPAGVAGMELDSWVLCHELQTLEAEDFRREIGILPPPLLAQVEAGLRHALDLP